MRKGVIDWMGLLGAILLFIGGALTDSATDQSISRSVGFDNNQSSINVKVQMETKEPEAEYPPIYTGE